MVKIKKIKFLLVLGFLFFIFICIGCSNEHQINTNIYTNYISMNKGDSVEGDCMIIAEYDDLSFLFVDNIPEKYNEDFFLTNSLIVFTIVGTNKDKSGEIKSYLIENETITINVESVDSKQSNSSTNWYYILEITAREIESSKLIEIYKNKKMITRKKILSKDGIAYENYLRQFQLEEEKWFWEGDISDGFLDNSILIDLKKTSTYPKFNLRYLGITEATGFDYISGPLPPDYFFKEEYADLLNKFRQSIVVYLVPQDKEKIIEIIRKIEKLEFVKHVSPNLNFNTKELN